MPTTSSLYNAVKPQGTETLHKNIPQADDTTKQNLFLCTKHPLDGLVETFDFLHIALHPRHPAKRFPVFRTLVFLRPAASLSNLST